MLSARGTRSTGRHVEATRCDYACPKAEHAYVTIRSGLVAASSPWLRKTFLHSSSHLSSTVHPSDNPAPLMATTQVCTAPQPTLLVLGIPDANPVFLRSITSGLQDTSPSCCPPSSISSLGFSSGALPPSSIRVRHSDFCFRAVRIHRVALPRCSQLPRCTY